MWLCSTVMTVSEEKQDADAKQIALLPVCADLEGFFRHWT
jgi:hypothetical protein